MRAKHALSHFALGFCLVQFVTHAATPLAPATAPASPSLSAAGNSFCPLFSSDGRQLLFTSQANNLATNDDLGPNLDLFLCDLATRYISLVSVATNGGGGANADVGVATISSNGQWVAFESAASNLACHDANNQTDIFVRDLTAGITRLISVDTNGSPCAQGKSSAPLISADGRLVLFESTAQSLVPGLYTTNAPQLFLRDLQANTTALISINASGTGPGHGKAENATLSGDACWVAFSSTATNLVLGVTNHLGEIYLRDLRTGTTSWISSNAAPYFAGLNYQCLNPVLSADASALVFQAFSSNTNLLLVFWRELASGNTVCIASNSSTASWPELSADGRRLAFVEQNQVFLWDSQSQSRQLISVCYDGTNSANSACQTPLLSPDSTQIAFLSGATDLLTSNAPNSDAPIQVYVRDLTTHTTLLVTVTSDGMPAAESSQTILPVFSPDGRWLAFECSEDHLVQGDQNRASDIFLRDLLLGTTELVTISAAALPNLTGTAHSSLRPLCLSSNGQYALISSYANNLGLPDQDKYLHLYWMDLLTGNKMLLSPTTNPACPNGGPLVFPTLSADGSTAIFVRQPNEGYLFHTNRSGLAWFNLDATSNLVAGLFPASYQNDWQSSLSADGRWLAYAAAPNAAFNSPTYQSVLLRDLQTGTNLLVSHRANSTTNSANGNSWTPRISPDGQWIVFGTKASDMVTGSYSPYLVAYHPPTNGFRLIVSATTTGAVFNARSRYVFFAASSLYSGTNVYRHDLQETNATLQNTLVATNALAPAPSADGQVIAYRSATKPYQVYVRDLASNTVELISACPDGITPGNASSDNPQISPDGRFVLFASKASNLLPYDRNPYTDIFLRDRKLGVTYLLSANPKTGRSGNAPSVTPAFSADGSTIAFASIASDLVAGDFSASRDVFVAKLTMGDRDGDGMDDAWEMAYFGNLNRDGSGDLDGDGISDGNEYRAGTDPTNQGSVLKALAMSSPGSRQTTLMWPAAKGARYQIQFKQSLSDTAWNNLDASITINGNTAIAADPQAGLDAARFYRILLLP